MGMDASAHIFFGIICEDEQELPWGDDKWDEIKDWWIHEVGGFPQYTVWDESGEKKPGVTKEQIDQWYVKKDAHEKLHPLPIELLNLYQDDCGCMLAVSATVHYTYWGHNKEINPDEMKLDESKAKAFREFIEKYVPDMKNEPLKWYLVADYG